MENVRIRKKLGLVLKNDNGKTIKQQSRITFNRFHELYTKYDSVTFKQTDFLIDAPKYLGFAVLELSKLHIYET